MTNPSGPSGPAFDPYRLWLQVPENTRPPTHYQLLGLAFGETNEEVIRQATLMRSAYVRHFQNGPNAADANRILEELAEASRVLLDPELRVAYEAKVKPASKPAARPPSVSASKQVVIQPPKAPVPDYEVADKPERKPKKKAKRPKWRRNLVSNLFGIVALGAALGVVGYLANVYFRSPGSLAAKSEAPQKEEKKQKSPAGASNQTAETPNGSPSTTETSGPRGTNSSPVNSGPAGSGSTVPRPRSADALVVRLSVDPPDARLTLEPIGDRRPGAPQASLEGEGSERTIVAEKGALPLVIAASGAGYQPNRITVFSSDAGRLVVVQLQKGGGVGSMPTNPLQSSPLPGSPSRRPVGAYQRGIALSTKDAKPVWRYSVARPAYDWATPTFGDVLWKESEGAFGTKSGKNAVKAPGVWIRTPWASKELWLRTKIDLPAAVKVGSIRWYYRTSGPVEVYVNGVEQFSAPGTGMLVSVRESPGGLFQGGENTIGVHASNPSGPALVDVGFEWIATEEAR